MSGDEFVAYASAHHAAPDQLAILIIAVAIVAFAWLLYAMASLVPPDGK